MFGAGINAQLGELFARERRFFRHHALHGFFDDAFGMRAIQNEFRRGGFDTTGMAGMAIINLVFQFPAGELHFIGIDDDDMVTGIDMRRETNGVLSAQNFRDMGSQAAQDDAISINQQPFMVNFLGLSRIRAHNFFTYIGKRAQNVLQETAQVNSKKEPKSAIAAGDVILGLLVFRTGENLTGRAGFDDLAHMEKTGLL
jgi:hypothetical protein